MPNIDLSKLSADFRSKIETLINNCKMQNVEMRPYFGIRTPFEQAKLWRQSRSSEEVRERISTLKTDGAKFLAHCIESVGAQLTGPEVTKAIPGLSWHQWGEAVDSVWIVDGKANWSERQLVNGINGYKVYAEEAKKLSLDAGLFWRFKDSPHVQLRPVGSPQKMFGLLEIDKKMEEMFG
jgi:peptidoglycan LD-endopeptidase CwlK